MGERDARERFARAVDEGVTHSDDQEFGAELDLVTSLRHLGAEPETDRRTRHDIAARIGRKITETAPEEAGETGGTVPPARSGDEKPRRRLPARPVVAAAFCLLVSLAGLLIMLSETSLPGEPLYPLKRARESVALALTFDKQEEAMQRLSYAADRVEGLSELAEHGLTAEESAGYRAGLEDFETASRAASVLLTELATDRGGNHLGKLRTWAASQARELSRLAPALPPELVERQRNTLALLTHIQQRARALHARFDCYRITTGRSDELGAVPASGRCLPPGSDPAQPAPSIPAVQQPDPAQRTPPNEQGESARPPAGESASEDTDSPELRRLSMPDREPVFRYEPPDFEHIEPAPLPPSGRQARLPENPPESLPTGTLSGLVNKLLPPLT